MITEVLDTLAEYLDGNLNAHIAALEVGPSDAALPPIAGVFVPHRDAAWAKGEVPQADGPVLLLRQDGQYGIDVLTETVQNRSTDFQVVFALVVREGAAEIGELQAGYFLRALYRCLHHMMHREPSSVCFRRGVRIEGQRAWMAAPVKKDLPNGAIRAAALATFEVVETQPYSNLAPPEPL